MTNEFETKFRRGESRDKPIGGNVSPEPFPQAFYSLARSRRIESQLKIAEVLCTTQSKIGSWLRGESVPSPAGFGSILVRFQPNDNELDSIIEPYGDLLQKAAESRVRTFSEASRRSWKLKEKLKDKTPFEDWVEELCQTRQISSKAFEQALASRYCFRSKSLRFHFRGPLSLDRYSEILQIAPGALDLSSQQTDSLSEAVAKTIEDLFATGHKFKEGINGRGLAVYSRTLPYKTYNSVEVAGELGISREWVRQLRMRLNLPPLLTEEQLEMLRKRKVGNLD